jgi:hypothetical protein
MSQKIDKENTVEETAIIPAMLQKGEPIISEEKAKEFKSIIEEIVATKAEEKLELENIITNKIQNSKISDGTSQGITAVNNGVIGTGKIVKKTKASPKKEEKKVEKVAIYSTKNVTWSEVGKVYRGYNLVTPEQAEKWLTRNHTRLATPQEVAQEFNK